VQPATVSDVAGSHHQETKFREDYRGPYLRADPTTPRGRRKPPRNRGLIDPARDSDEGRATVDAHDDPGNTQSGRVKRLYDRLATILRRLSPERCGAFSEHLENEQENDAVGSAPQLIGRHRDRKSRAASPLGEVFSATSATGAILRC
jgi:hypothetical protein